MRNYRTLNTLSIGLLGVGEIGKHGIIIITTIIIIIIIVIVVVV